MGELILWTSIEGYRNVHLNKKFFAYSNKTSLNILQVIIPMSAVCTYTESAISAEGIEFYCYEKELW